MAFLIMRLKLFLTPQLAILASLSISPKVCQYMTLSVTVVFACCLGDVISKQPPMVSNSHDNTMYEFSDRGTKFKRATGNIIIVKLIL